MDDLTAIRSFRAERDAEPPEARAAAWRALEAHMDAAAAEARGFGEAVAGAQRPADPPRRGFLWGRRRVLAFAGAVAVAAIVAGTLVLSSGPTAQPASAAEILHEAAGAAASSSASPTTSVLGPGQYSFHKERRLSVMGWVSPVPSPKDDIPTASTGGTMKYSDAYNALVPTQVESWIGDDGRGRYREVLGSLEFWDQAEEDRWKAAGSPLPPPFNPEYRRLYPIPYRGALEANSHVVDLEHEGYGQTFHFPDTSKLPTDPQALRQAVEANSIEVEGFNLMYPKAKHLDAEQTKEELINVLFEGGPSAELEAAIFNALAEVPGVRLTPATDSLGRHGDAIKFAVEEGVRREYLFDPETSDLLASRGVLVDPAASRSYKELPAGTTIAERDFIDAGVVDSTHETPAGPEAKG
jgi:hypothetical protein